MRSQRRDHGLAREVAGLVAAHAVGDRPDAGFRAHQIAVLVALAHLADMGRGAGIEHRSDTFCMAQPVRGYSRSMRGVETAGQHLGEQKRVGHAAARRTPAAR